MRTGVSQTMTDRNATYRDEDHPLHDVVKKSMRESNQARPPMDIIYVASLIPKDKMDETLLRTMKRIEPVQDGDGVEDYIGIYCGKGGRFSMRTSNFVRETGMSRIYQRTVGAEDPDFCAQKKVILCNSTYTKEIGEGFLMVLKPHFISDCFLY